MRIVAYHLVSTAKHGASGLGLEAQKSAIAAYAAEKNGKILEYSTEVGSCKRNDRPQLAKAMYHARVTGAVLVIAKLDRLSRNAAFLLNLQ